MMQEDKWYKKALIYLIIVIFSPLILIGLIIFGITTLFQAPTLKKLKYAWPENLLRELKNMLTTLDDAQMKGLGQAILTLKPREQEIIRLYYEEYKTQAEIAAIIGVSSTRISQIRHKALRKLRHPSRSNFIRYGYQEEMRGS